MSQEITRGQLFNHAYFAHLMIASNITLVSIAELM